MKSITFDTNCLIDLRADEPAPDLLALVKLSRLGVISLQIPAVVASERQQDGSQLANFALFRTRLAELGLDSARILKPLAYHGLSYIDWALLTPVDGDPIEREIHGILFPRIAFAARDHCEREDVPGRRRWRNAKCDVLALWCHIHHGGDIFVTEDRNFHKISKRTRLEKLGAGTIARPKDALALVAP